MSVPNQISRETLRLAAETLEADAWRISQCLQEGDVCDDLNDLRKAIAEIHAWLEANPET